jgi:hypothetical protein
LLSSLNERQAITITAITNFEVLLHTYFVFKKKVKFNYSSAESLLLSELGLSDWKPQHKLSFIENYSKVKENDRYDAEYYQPKYEEIIQKITGRHFNAEPGLCIVSNASKHNWSRSRLSNIRTNHSIIKKIFRVQSGRKSAKADC